MARPWSKRVLHKHDNNTTVAFEVLTAFYIKEKDTWSLKVCWWNIGKCHEPWPMAISQRIKIKETDRKNWKAIPCRTL
jgi:hypothetical protein